MPVQLTLPGTITQRGREPEILSGSRRRSAGARDGEIEQRLDPRRLVGIVLQRGSPPDVRARFERHGRGGGRVARGEIGEVRRGGGEAPAVQRVEPGANISPLGAGVLQQGERGEEEPHRYRGSAARASLTRRATASRACAAGEPGSAATTGWPVSARSASRACSGTWPSSGTPSSSARRVPPPARKISVRSPQCGHTK